MKKLELYYNKERDCLQLVIDGVLKYHDEFIYSTEFLTYFKEDIEDVHELKEDIQKYFENVKKQSIQGELIVSRELEEGVELEC